MALDTDVYIRYMLGLDIGVDIRDVYGRYEYVLPCDIGVGVKCRC